MHTGFTFIFITKISTFLWVAIYLITVHLWFVEINHFIDHIIIRLIGFTLMIDPHKKNKNIHTYMYINENKMLMFVSISKYLT